MPPIVLQRRSIPSNPASSPRIIQKRTFHSSEIKDSLKIPFGRIFKESVKALPPVASIVQPKRQIEALTSPFPITPSGESFGGVFKKRFAPADIPLSYPQRFAGEFATGVVGDVLDIATTPVNYAIPTLIKAITPLVARIPIGKSTLGRIATTQLGQIPSRFRGEAPSVTKPPSQAELYRTSPTAKAGAIGERQVPRRPIAFLEPPGGLTKVEPFRPEASKSIEIKPPKVVKPQSKSVTVGKNAQPTLLPNLKASAALSPKLSPEAAIPKTAEAGRFSQNNPPISEEPISAVKLDDGSIFYDRSARIHSDVIQNLKITPEKVIDGGFIVSGEYKSTGSADVARIGRIARAKKAIEQRKIETGEITPKQKLLNKIEEAKANISKSYSDLSTEEANELSLLKFKIGNAEVSIKNSPFALEEFKSRIEKGITLAPRQTLKNYPGLGTPPSKPVFKLNLSNELGQIKIGGPEYKKRSIITPVQPGQIAAKAIIPKRVIGQPEKKVDLSEVKGKVNIFDYLRTPEKVLEKIGFGEESKVLRKGYENYLKELPQELGKITEWSKRVPKESDLRIFEYLDGKAVQLNESELKVANEIQGYLAHWADRLKLPEDRRITHYITHIFDKELLGKEFDPDLAKIIENKIPGEIYDPFLEKRLGAKGFKKSTWNALDAYVKRATRKVNIDPALELIKGKAGSTLQATALEESQFKYLKRYVDNVNMRPSEIETLLDNSIKSIVGYKFGQRPVTALSGLLRRLTYRAMLGINPTSALRNISQGINTYAVLGEKYTTIGYANLFKQGAWKEASDEGVFMHHFVQDMVLSATKKNMEKVDKVLFSFFEAAERINRASAYFGAKAKGISKGMTEQKAIEYAKSIVRKTQFSFGSIDTPVALQNDIARTLFQFQNYNLKQIEFLSELAKDKNFIGLLRYAVAGITFVYTIGRAFGMRPEHLIPGLRFDAPVSLKLPIEAGKAALNVPDKYGRERTFKRKASDIGKSALGLIPGGSQIRKTYGGLKLIGEGGSFDSGGRRQYKAPSSTLGEMQAILFGKYSTGEAQDYFNRKKSKPFKKIKSSFSGISNLKL